VSLSKFFAKVIENWPAKVLSLALAILLLIYHRMSLLETRIFFTPVVVEQLSAMMPSNSYPRIIKVSLKGESQNLKSILEEDIEVYVNLREIKTPGTYNAAGQWRKKGTAQGVEPLQITVDPMEITCSLDHKISKFVPIAVNLAGQVEAGYNMNSYSIEPNQVVVEGPATLMGSLSELNTELIDLTGRINDFSVSASLLHSDPLIVIRGDGIVNFSASISQIIPVRNISNVPIVITGMNEQFAGELEIKTANIHIEGYNRDTVESFVPPNDFLRVDCSEISESGDYVLSVLVRAAAGLSFRVEPREVRIQITVIEIEDGDQ
jgi:YbbR domain-containing protein